MATLPQLPNEMIAEIWSHVVEPRDIESFATVSKNIYAIGTPFVEEHNRLKREYSLFETGPNADPMAPASLLKDVLLRPRVALYVTHLYIGRYQEHGQDLDDDSDEYIYPEDDMALFIKAIRKATLVPQDEVEGWIKAVRGGNDDPIFALLTLLLPNLTTFTLVIESIYTGYLSDTFERIAKAENSPFLTRLSTVNLHVELAHHDDFMDWEWLRIITILPLVQSLHVKGMSCMEIDDLFGYNPQFIPSSSNITELTFIKSGCRPKSMFQLLESIRGLKRFSYVEPDEELDPFEPFLMRSALLAHAKHSLETLRIIFIQTKEGNLLGTFRGFTALRELETNLRLIIFPTKFDEVADLLPASIEKVHLHIGVNRSCECVSLLVETFPKAKSQRLPNLKTLTLSSDAGIGLTQEDNDLFKTLEETSRDVGIELSVIGGYTS